MVKWLDDLRHVRQPSNSQTIKIMGPLKGFKIIEMAGLGPGPFAGMILADMGAEVIMVERKADPKKNEIKHFYNKINMPVMTKQEIELDFNFIEKVEPNEQKIVAFYKNEK